MLEKYFEVQWERMMTDQRGQKDKKGKSWKQMNISGTLLLNSIVCDRYLCSKVVSTLGSDGIRLNVKPIQVLRTVIIGCLICVSNSVNLVAVKAILVKLCGETELQMFAKGKAQGTQRERLPRISAG